MLSWYISIDWTLIWFWFNIFLLFSHKIGTHSCHPSAKCINYDGHFECVCPENTTDITSTEPCRLSEYTHAPDCYCIHWIQTIFSICVCFCFLFRPLFLLGCLFEDMEIADGERVSPHNQPCNICTCNKGVITCEEPACNCSTWKKGSGRDLCCPQCDPKESCLHQELKHIVFRSGEQWIYQCQTCECLVSIHYICKSRHFSTICRLK